MKTYTEFINEAKQLDENKLKLAKMAFKGITKLTKSLSKSMRAGPKFKASIPSNVPTVNLYHGTSSNLANKIRTQGLASATGNINKIKDYNKKFYKGMSFEPGRAYVTDSGKGADAYAIMTARAQNRGLLRRLGIRKKVKPEVVRVTVPKSDLRQAVNRNEFTANIKTIQPSSSKKVSDMTGKEANEFIRRTRKSGDLHSS